MIERFKQVKSGMTARYRAWREGMSEGQFGMVRAVVILAALAAAAGIGYLAARPFWRGWRHDQAMSQAMAYAEQQDYRSTMLALKRATDLAPLDLATWREVADKLAELGSPQALVARENVVRLSPGDMAMRLALVEEALRFGQLDIAQSALTGIDRAAQEDAGFYRLAAAVALALGRSEALEENLARLVAAQPDDAVARFNLAAVRLWSADPGRQSEALGELEAMVSSPAVRVRASLELLKHAARIRDAQRARMVVNLLLDRFNVPPDLRGAAANEPRGWSALLQALRTAAEFGGPEDVALVARWMSEVRLRREALDWIDSLPAGLRDARPVARVNTLLSAELDDFDRLEPLLRAGGLGALPVDATRLAIASRLQHLRYQAVRGRSTWEDAITACGGAVPSLTALARLAEIWRDADGNERTLQEIIRLQPKTNWVYEALRNSHAARGDTVKLWQLYGSWASVQPDDEALVQNWLSLAAVLDRFTTETSTMAIRRGTREGASPLDRALAAAALWRGKRPEEAVSIIDALPAEDRDRADIAFWRAVILAEAGRPQDAREALVNARRPGLSAEERGLLDRVDRSTIR